MTLRPLRSLLCPIELERPSLDALSYAFFLAEAFYASLEVACTRAPLRLLPSEPDVRSETAGRTPHAREEQASRARLDELLRGVTTAVPGRASAHIVEGEMIAEVLHCARRFHSDLVVVGSQFEARPDWLFGASLGEQIASMAPCPTISIHEGGQRQTTRVKHILLPVDPRAELLSLEWTTLFASTFRPHPGSASPRFTSRRATESACSSTSSGRSYGSPASASTRRGTATATRSSGS